MLDIHNEGTPSPLTGYDANMDNNIIPKRRAYCKLIAVDAVLSSAVKELRDAGLPITSEDVDECRVSLDNIRRIVEHGT